MVRIVTAVLLAALVLVALFKAPIGLFSAVVGLVALLCTYEYLSLVRAHELQPLWALTLLTVAFTILNTYMGIKLRTTRMMPPQATGWRVLLEPVYQYQVVLVLVSLAPLVMLAAAMLKENLRIALPSAASSYMAVPYIGITLTFLLLLRALLSNGALAIFYLFMIVWVGDIFAYYVGRFAGRHKLAPRISPNKSWEGAIASLVTGTAVGTLLLLKNSQLAAFASGHGLLPHPSVLFALPPSEPNPVWLAILASASINIAAQFGDLVESMIKRGANAKDSGVIVPGHGGILDRVDALLLAIPVLWYYASFRIIHF